jgi:hypothetical protein
LKEPAETLERLVDVGWLLAKNRRIVRWVKANGPDKPAIEASKREINEVGVSELGSILSTGQGQALAESCFCAAHLLRNITNPIGAFETLYSRKPDGLFFGRCSANWTTD